MSTTTSKKDQAQEHVERAKDAAGGVADKVKEVASNVGQAAGNAASAVGQTAGNVATTIGHKAEDATAAAGRGMQNLGSTVRDKAPESGFLGTAADKVAGGLESAGKYLEDKNLSGMAEDLTGMIRRNPIPALLIGIGLGFLLARTMRS
jgi:uncharacterized phage infection (PIP) family protein YhgE